MLAGPEGERLWAYWRKQLAGQLPCWTFPPIGRDRRCRPIRAPRTISHLNDGLSSRLKALAKAQGATLYMVLLAAFQVILHYHTGQDDLLVGSPMLGRSRAEFEGIVGLFTNPVILRANLFRETRRFEGISWPGAPNRVGRARASGLSQLCSWSSGCVPRGISAVRHCARLCSSWINLID